MKTSYNNIREREEAAQTLLAAYRQGDQNAFMSLYDMYAEMLLNYGLCITSDKELVKDCVQDVFIKLISKIQDLQVTKVTSYLLISLRNRLLDEFRRKNYMTETAVEDIRISTTVEDVENSYILDESSLNNVRKVQILMDELTPRQRQVFTLYYIEISPARDSVSFSLTFLLSAYLPCRYIILVTIASTVESYPLIT